MAAETTPVHHRRARQVRAPGQQRRARRRLRLSARATGAAFGLIVLLAVGQPALASCGSLIEVDDLPVLFEGRTDGWAPDPESSDRIYRWTVERPIRGVEAGDDVDIVMYVGHVAGEMFVSTSIDVGHEPTLGDLYLVGAAGSPDSILVASSCGGLLQAVADPTQEPDNVGPAVRPWRGHAVIAGAVPMVAALMALASARRAG